MRIPQQTKRNSEPQPLGWRVFLGLKKTNRCFFMGLFACLLACFFCFCWYPKTFPHLASFFLLNNMAMGQNLRYLFSGVPYHLFKRLFEGHRGYGVCLVSLIFMSLMVSWDEEQPGLHNASQSSPKRTESNPAKWSGDMGKFFCENWRFLTGI